MSKSLKEVLDQLKEGCFAGNPSLEDPASVEIDDHFNLLVNCAVRYALTRHTYVPEMIIEYLTPLLPKLNFDTLCGIMHDIEDEVNRIEYRVPPNFQEAMEQTKQKWICFHTDVQDVLQWKYCVE